MRNLTWPFLVDTNKADESAGSRLASFFQLSEVRLYTVLGCIAALVLVALMQATCTIYKTTKKSNRHKVISVWPPSEIPAK